MEFFSPIKTNFIKTNWWLLIGERNDSVRTLDNFLCSSLIIITRLISIAVERDSFETASTFLWNEIVRVALFFQVLFVSPFTHNSFLSLHSFRRLRFFVFFRHLSFFLSFCLLFKLVLFFHKFFKNIIYVILNAIGTYILARYVCAVQL